MSLKRFGCRLTIHSRRDGGLHVGEKTPRANQTYGRRGKTQQPVVLIGAKFAIVSPRCRTKGPDHNKLVCPPLHVALARETALYLSCLWRRNVSQHAFLAVFPPYLLQNASSKSPKTAQLRSNLRSDLPPSCFRLRTPSTKLYASMTRNNVFKTLGEKIGLHPMGEEPTLNISGQQNP